MKRLWEDWQADRTKTARKEFDELLNENSFVGFWGGVGKMGVQEGKEKGTMGTVVPGMEDIEDGPVDEDEGAGGKVDLKTLAKGIGRKQVEDVLKSDKRYQVFAHIPEQRTQWVEVSDRCLWFDVMDTNGCCMF